MAFQEQASERSITRINEDGNLQQIYHGKWVNVDGYFAYDKMVELMTFAYGGKLEEAKSIDMVFWPQTDEV